MENEKKISSNALFAYLLGESGPELNSSETLECGGFGFSDILLHSSKPNVYIQPPVRAYKT